MPLAIMLQQHLSVLTKGVRRIDRWRAVTETFELVVARLRSAYLVRWFGTRLPTRGLALNVAFVNMDALRRRWSAIGGGRRVQTPAIGPNLTEPLLGLGGTLVGILASPVNSVLLGLTLGTLVDRWYTQLFAVANWLTGGLLGGGILGLAGIAGGVGLLVGLAAGAISGQLRGGFDLLGALAEIVEPLQALWEQVSGPREAVRNPLLRELLILGDRLAALVAALLGAFSVLVTRIGPLLAPIALGFLATARIGQELWGLVRFVLEQTIEFVTGLLSTVPRAMRGAIVPLTRGFSKIGALFTVLWETISGSFSRFAGASAVLVGWWWRAGQPFVRAHTIDHPTVSYVRSFIAQLGVAKGWRARTAAPSTPSSSSGGTFGKVLGALGAPPAPPLPHLPGLPPLLSLALITPLAHAAADAPSALPNPLDLGVGRPMDLGPAAGAVLRRAQHPPSIFAGERAALRAAQARPEALERSLETATYLSLAARIVSPAAAEHVRTLEGLLTRLDATIRTERPHHPVRDLPEPTELSPQIRTLRVRARGLAPAAVRAWTEELRRELNATPYPVPAAG